MAAFPGALGEVLVRAPTEAAAFAGGIAIAPALAPIVQDLVNFTWSEHPSKALDLIVAAEVAAEDVAAYDAMQTEAGYHGFNPERFRWAYGATLNAPGVGELITLLRRNHEVRIDFAHGLRKAKLETLWDDALTNLKDARLSPQQIALGIVRSVIADPGLLATTLDLSGGIVPAYPVWPGDALAEALTGGFDKDRLRVLVGEIGLPMSAQQAASAYFRKIIEHGDFNRAILEGDTRPEWAPYILEQARQIPSAVDFVQGRLRGWIDDAAMNAGSAKHGMSEADTHLLFNIHGRPLSFHQVFIGLRRGGKYDGPTADIAPAFLTALKQSDIRPEWYNLAWAQRYAYPTAFVLRTLTEAGDLTQAETEQILLYEGWEPTLATKVSTKWAGGTTTSGDPHEAKAQTQLWNTAHRAYVAREIDDATATTALTAAGVTTAGIPGVLSTWNVERDLIRKQLSPKEIQKAIRDQVPNPATGQPWTVQDAIAALVARGYDTADATVLVDEA